MNRIDLNRDYDLNRGMLRPDHSRLANAHHIRRNPATDEITWSPSTIEAQLRELKLI